MQSVRTTLKQPHNTTQVISTPSKAGISWELLLSEYSVFENEVENCDKKQALREHDYCYEIFKLLQEEDRKGGLYQVEEILGKGRGIIASKFIKKGTLILKEGPQMPKIQIPPAFAKWDWTNLDQMNFFQLREYLENKYVYEPGLKLELEEYVQKIVSFFDQMSENDQRLYLMLGVGKTDGRLKTLLRMHGVIIMEMETGMGNILNLR